MSSYNLCLRAPLLIKCSRDQESKSIDILQSPILSCIVTDIALYCFTCMCFLEFKSMSDFTCQKSKVCENTGLLTHFLFVLFYSISTFGYFWLSCSQQTWLFWVRASCLLSISSSYMALFNRPGKCFEKSISKTAVGVAVFFEFEKLCNVMSFLDRVS